MTRTAAISVIRCSAMRLYGLIAEGRLHPVKVGSEVYFADAEVLQVARDLAKDTAGRDAHALARLVSALNVRTVPRNAQERVAAERAAERERVEGENAVQAFQLFDLGADMPEVVARLALTPNHVRELYAEWKTSLERGWKKAARAAASPDSPLDEDDEIDEMFNNVRQKARRRAMKVVESSSVTAPAAPAQDAPAPLVKKLKF